MLFFGSKFNLKVINLLDNFFPYFFILALISGVFPNSLKQLISSGSFSLNCFIWLVGLGILCVLFMDFFNIDLWGRFSFLILIDSYLWGELIIICSLCSLLFSLCIACPELSLFISLSISNFKFTSFFIILSFSFSSFFLSFYYLLFFLLHQFHN